MGGKSSQSQSTVTIPPEVLARYNAVNQRADEVTNRPYQNYSGQFVAPVNAQQQQGIAGVNAAANQAQPYYGAATGQLTQAQNAAQGYNQAATGNIYGAQNVGNAYANQSSQSLQGAGQAAAGLQGQAAQAYGSAYGNAQGYNNTAGAQYAGAQGAAQPLQNQASQNITNAQNVGGSMTQNAYNTLQGAGQSAQPLQNQAAQGYQQAYANAQGYNNQATGMYGSAMQSAQPLNQQSAQNITSGQAIGSDFARQAAGSLQGAGQSAAGLQDQAAQAYGNANMAGQAGGLAAANLYNQSLNQSQGYNQAAGQNIAGAQAAANPLNQAAVGLAGAATQAINASPLDTNSINQYMSPYLQNVVGSQAQLLNQGNQQAMAGQLGNAVRSGAFGGDRAGIAAANLNQQQQLANASIYSNLLNQGYNTALQTAQQQQGVNLGAGQANRAALMAGSQQIGALGQQQFGQGMSAAQQQAALGQQVYGQQAGAGQNFAALGQQQFGQGLAGGQAQAALGQQQYAQGANTAAQQAALGQQQFGQNLSAAQQQAALGQQQFGQATTTGQNLAAIGQQQFNQGSTTAQNQAALGQQQYAQGANTAAQQAAMGQQLYGQGMGAAQQQAALGQQQFGQANTTGQNMAALGQQQFGQGLAAGQAQQSLGQQQYTQGANTAAQQAALGQQQFGQGMTASQQQAAIGQQVYGQGANTSASLANLGLGAQNAALQGAQAQIGAGTLQQQTQQAQNQAEYNQFLQAQSLPYQQLAQQAAIAQGTGALSGSSTYGIAPGGFFSDERLKQDIEPVGKTFDGQTVYKYRYKGDPKDKTQIGLIAQDVEHKHPSAVGLAGGYKTVNYDKATNAAADRGHFYAGGLVPESMGGHVDASHFDEGYAYGGVPDGSTPVAPGLTGADMAALIQAQSAMYAPGHGGLYGSAPGGAPYGGTQIVPAQTGASPRMMEPGELPKYRSPAEHAKDFAEAAKGFKDVAESDSGKKAISQAKKMWNKATAPETKEMGGGPEYKGLSNYEAEQYAAHGGAIRHYADGGLAGAEDKDHFTDKTSLDIPIPSAENKLAPPELPGEGKSGLSDLANIAKIAAMFMAAANGGRINQHRFHKNDGGSLPYSNMPDGSLSIPTPQDSASGNKLAAPSLPGAGPTGLQNTANLAQTAAGATLAGQGISSALAPAAVGAAGAGAAGAGAGAAAAGAGAAGAGAAGTGMMAALGPVGIGALGVMALSQLFKSKGGQVGYASGGLAGREHHADADPTGAVGRADDDAISTEDGSFSNWYKKQNEDFAGSPVGKVVRGGINLAKDHVIPSTYNLLTKTIPLTAYDAAAGVVNAAGKLGSASGGYQLPIYNPLNPDEPLNSSANVGLRPTAGVAPPAAQFRVTPSSAQAPAVAAQNPFAKNPLAPATQKPPVTAAQKPRVAAPAPAKPGLGAATDDGKLAAMGLPAESAATAGGLAPPVQGALTPGSESNVSMQNDLNRMPVEVAAKPPARGLAPPAAPPAAGKPSMIDKLKSSLLQNEKGEYDSSKIIPLLTGIAAMGTAPTRSLGTALATGVGAGAQAYLPTKQRQAQLAQTQAETATGVSASATQGDFVILADGKRLLKSQYRALAAQGKAPALMGEKNVAGISGVPENAAAVGNPQQDLAGMVGTPTSKYVGDVGNSSIENGYKRLVQMDPSQWAGEREISTRTELGIVQNSASAHSQGSTLAQLAPTLMKLPENGVLAGGPLAEFRSSLIGRVNDIVRSVGAAVGIDPQQYVIGDVNPNDPLALKAAADKLGAALQFARANGADQNSLGALEAAAKAVPSSSLSKPQAMQVLSSLYIDKQHALDQEQYLKEYKDNLAAMHPGMSDLYLSQNAMTAFRQEHSELEYAMAKEALMSIFQYAPEALSGKFSREQINSYGRQRGIKDLARFLENR